MKVTYFYDMNTYVLFIYSYIECCGTFTKQVITYIVTAISSHSFTCHSFFFLVNKLTRLKIHLVKCKALHPEDLRILENLRLPKVYI